MQVEEDDMASRWRIVDAVHVRGFRFEGDDGEERFGRTSIRRVTLSYACLDGTTQEAVVTQTRHGVNYTYGSGEKEGVREMSLFSGWFADRFGASLRDEVMKALAEL
jgi:hypothetical protein